MSKLTEAQDSQEYLVEAVAVDIKDILEAAQKRLGNDLEQSGPQNDLELWCLLTEWRHELDSELTSFIADVRVDTNE